MIYIEIDDLVGNAFIPYLEKTGRHSLSLIKIDNYGKKVVDYLNKNGIRACLRVSRDLTNEFFYEYSDLFELDESGNENVVILKENITRRDLIRKFSIYLTVKVIVAFRKEENIKVLFE